MRAQTLLAATASERFLNRLRAAAFEKLQALPLGFFEQERTGVLVSRLTSDVQALDEFLREALVEVVGSGLQIALTVGRARDPLAHAGARLAGRAAGADRRRAGRSTTAPAAPTTRSATGSRRR